MGNQAGSRIEVGWGARRHGVRWGGPGTKVAAAVVETWSDSDVTWSDANYTWNGEAV